MERIINVIHTSLNVIITFFLMYSMGYFAWINKVAIMVTFEIGIMFIILLFIFKMIENKNR
jgi:hypothetical protein